MIISYLSSHFLKSDKIILVLHKNTIQIQSLIEMEPMYFYVTQYLYFFKKHEIENTEI